MKQITIPAKVEKLDTLLDFITDIMQKLNINEMLQSKISVAVEEIFVNIAHYAYPSKDGDVIISVNNQNDRIMIELRDTGVPYNPLEKEDPDITLSAEERSIGGLGIFMVKKIMDDVTYEYNNGQNILTLIKNYTP